MMCQACNDGRHWDCGMQTWCECACDPIDALYDFSEYLIPDGEVDWNEFENDDDNDNDN